MQKARQQHGEMHYDFINRIHLPIACGSTLFLLVLDCDSQPGNCGPDRNHAAGRRAREERPHRSGGAMPLVPSLSQTVLRRIFVPLHMPGNEAGDSLRCKQRGRAWIGQRVS
jgi:hypothetical protein